MEKEYNRSETSAARALRTVGKNKLDRQKKIIISPSNVRDGTMECKNIQTISTIIICNNKTYHLCVRSAASSFL